jgi:hypothetical protein
MIHNRRHGAVCFTLLLLLIFIFIQGCGSQTIRTAIQKSHEALEGDPTVEAGGILGETSIPGYGNGKLNSPFSFGGKCRALYAWIDRLENEYPGIDLRNRRDKNLDSKVANLYRDEYFIPVFGGPYDQSTAVFRRDVSEKILKGCFSGRNTRAIGPDKYRAHTKYRDAVLNAMSSGRRGKFQFETISPIVVKRRLVVKRLNEAVQSANSGAPGIEVFQKFEAEEKDAITDLAGFYPSDQTKLKARYASTKQILATRVVKTMLEKGPKVDYSLHDPHEALDKYRQEFDRLNDLVGSSDQTALQEKRDANLTLAAKKLSTNAVESAKNIDISDINAEYDLKAAVRKFSQSSTYLDADSKADFQKQLDQNVWVVAAGLSKLVIQKVNGINFKDASAEDALESAVAKFSGRVTLLKGSDKEADLQGQMDQGVTKVAVGLVNSVLKKVKALDTTRANARTELQGFHEAFGRYSEFLKGPETNSLRSEMKTNVDSALVSLIEKRVRELHEIPATFSGIRETGDWGKAFEQDFKTFNGTKPYLSATSEYQTHKRERIETASIFFKAKLEELPATIAGLNSSVEMLDEIEEKTSHYDDFKRMTLARIDSMRSNMKSSPSSSSKSAGDDPFAMFGGDSPKQSSGLPAQGYKLPVLMRALYEGNFNEIPDDMDVRKYNLMLYKRFNINCGEAGMTALRHQVKYTGLDPKKVYIEATFGVLMGAIEASKKGGDILKAPADFEDRMRGRLYSEDGEDDARVLMSRYQCHDSQARRIRANLHQLMKERGKRRPKPKDAERYKTLRVVVDLSKNPEARKFLGGCRLHFNNSVFCSCANRGALKFDMAAEDKKQLAASFSPKRLKKMKAKYHEFGKYVAAVTNASRFPR